MMRSKRLQPVMKVAESRERDAARLLGEAQREREAQEARLAELIAYWDEYARRFHAQGDAGLDAARARDYRVFLSRLNEAIHFQRRRVEQCRLDYEASRQRWLATRARARAVDKAVARCRQQELRVAARREQRECDEYACRGRSGGHGEKD